MTVARIPTCVGTLFVLGAMLTWGHSEADARGRRRGGGAGGSQASSPLANKYCDGRAYRDRAFRSLVRQCTASQLLTLTCPRVVEAFKGKKLSQHKRLRTYFKDAIAVAPGGRSTCRPGEKYHFGALACDNICHRNPTSLRALIYASIYGWSEMGKAIGGSITSVTHLQYLWQARWRTPLYQALWYSTVIRSPSPRHCDPWDLIRLGAIKDEFLQFGLDNSIQEKFRKA